MGKYIVAFGANIVVEEATVEEKKVKGFKVEDFDGEKYYAMGVVRSIGSMVEAVMADSLTLGDTVLYQTKKAHRVGLGLSDELVIVSAEDIGAVVRDGEGDAQ